MNRRIAEYACEMLEKTAVIICGDRHNDYGPAHINFKNVIDACQKINPRLKLTLPEIAALNISIKVARIKNNAMKEDNWIDIAGYAACGYAITKPIEEINEAKLECITTARTLIYTDLYESEEVMDIMEVPNKNLDKLLEMICNETRNALQGKINRWFLVAALAGIGYALYVTKK